MKKLLSHWAAALRRPPPPALADPADTWLRRLREAGL